ncbi:18938_t:CDS:1 [Gigaspora margarita]|uniref:18938_t:CDS:1 n=1 Tax=Gigaspora margarita TaxID=4874 RepID=A0ABN7VZ61_GIGMA|nr:18938_t:CDS:1 [Gigaspora margarita]
MSIKEFFNKLIIDEISPDCNISINSFKTIDYIELSQTIVSGATTIQASSHCQIIESTKVFGLNIYYHLNISDIITFHLVPCQNALKILMQTQKKILLSLLQYKKLDNKQVLYNDIIEWIHQNGRGSLQSRMLIYKERDSLVVYMI